VKIILMLSILMMLGPVVWSAEMSVNEWETLESDVAASLMEYSQRVEDGLAPPIKCLTPIYLNLYHQRPKGASAKILYTDREDTMSFSYGTDHFLLHYTGTGANRVYDFDAQDSLPGVPNYIFNAGIILEQVYQHEIIDLGLPEPISDGTNGGDGRTDIYFVDFPVAAYGVTIAETQIVSYPVTASGYMFLENDYQEFNIYLNDRLAPLSVTAAHEYFHLIQFAMDFYEKEENPPGSHQYNAAWMEMSATYMEEENYDDVNDYYLYLPYIMDYPQWSLRQGTYLGGNLYDRNLHMYASVIWPLFLSENYGSAVVPAIWQKCAEVAGPNWWQATDEVIDSASAETEDIGSRFQEFTIWNLFTRDWYRSGSYYSEGSAYYNPFHHTAGFPGMAITQVIDAYPASIDIAGELRPEGLGANNLLLRNVSGYTGGLAVSFEPDGDRQWGVQVIGVGSNPAVGPIFIDSSGYDSSTSQIFITNASSFDKFVLIPNIPETDTLPESYHINVVPYEGSAGVVQPDGGEILYGGTTYYIAWYFNTDVKLVLIEVSYDDGETWSAVALTENDFIYEWPVPNQNSDQCLIRLKDGDNPTQEYLSSNNFAIVSEGSAVSKIGEPYPNPAWVQLHDNITFPFEVAPELASSGQQIKITIHSITGERVRELSKSLELGENPVLWDLTNGNNEKVAAGPYLATITFNGNTEVKKIFVFR